FTVYGVMRANLEDLLNGPFTDEDVNAVGALENDGHPAPLEIEGHLINLAELSFDLEFLLEFDMLEHCNIEQVLETGLVEAVQVGIFEDAIRVLAADIEVALQYDAVLR